MTLRICFLEIIWNWPANKLEFTVCFLAGNLLHCFFFPPPFFLSRDLKEHEEGEM